MGSSTFWALVSAINDAGEDSQMLRWTVKDPLTTYSNVVGGDFICSESQPQLSFPPDGLVSISGTSGSVDLNIYNHGKPADEWEYEGNLPPGAELKKSGVVEYVDIGVDGQEMADRRAVQKFRDEVDALIEELESIIRR